MESGGLVHSGALWRTWRGAWCVELACGMQDEAVVCCSADSGDLVLLLVLLVLLLVGLGWPSCGLSELGNGGE